MPDLLRILKELNIDASVLGKAPGDLPLLFHYGRSDASVVFFGCKISPEHIQELILKIPALVTSVHSFTMLTYEDRSVNKNLELCFELNDAAALPAIQRDSAELKKQIIHTLKLSNQDFRESMNVVPNEDKLQIHFYEPDGGPFQGNDHRIKRKYIQTLIS
jgi:phenylacetate-CoA ligase